METNLMDINTSRAIAKAGNLIRQKKYEDATVVLKKLDKTQLSASAKLTINKMLEISANHTSRPVVKQDSQNVAPDAAKSTAISGRLSSAITSLESEKNISLGYCILFMKHEKDVTRATLSNLLQQISPSDRIFLLFNGFIDQPLRKHFEKHTGIVCFESAANLGVAGGRNLLYKHVLDQDAAITHIITLDNDVLLPNDLNPRIKQQITEKYSSLNVGVMGGIILDYKVQEIRDYVDKTFLKFKGYFSADCYNIFSEDIQSYLSIKKTSLKKLLWHIGMDPDYFSGYIGRKDIDKTPQSSAKSFQPFLAHSSQVDSLISKAQFPVSNVPGCFQVFSVEHLRQIGLLEERFSPYFFEDAEFCIRSIMAGKQNIISTDLLLFHGTDGRHLERKHPDRLFQHLANEYRARYLLFRSLDIPNATEKLVLQAKQLFNSAGKPLSDEEKKLSARLEGIRKGMNQYSDLSDQDFELLRLDKPEGTFNEAPSPTPERSTPAPATSKILFDPSLPSSTESLPKTYFSRLKQFRNAYQGQECLIICNGPSLKNTNLGLFAGIPTFAVNSTFILQEQLDFRPTFYTIEDNHVVSDNLEQVIALNCGFKFFPEKYRPQLGDADNIFYLPASWDCYFKSKVSFEYPEFSTDIARVIYTGQTVTYLNLQLAYYFGFKTVYIVGLDFSYAIPKGARIDQNSIDHDEDDPNHFHPGYFGKGKQWHFPKLDSCMTAYSIAREQFERSGRRIVDLTIGGKLNVFEKQSLHEHIVVARKIPKIGPSLELTQYLIDYAHAIAYLTGQTVTVSQDDTATDQQDELAAGGIRLAHYKTNQCFEAAVFRHIKESKNNNLFAVAFSSARLLITSGNISAIQGLPFCGWIDSTLSNAYLELIPNSVNGEIKKGFTSHPYFERYKPSNPEIPNALSMLRGAEPVILFITRNGVYMKHHL